ncbi:Sec-independent protein translocase subunit TatA [Mycolicibacterium aubagnense]
MGGLQPWHWLIVIAVFVLLFGAKKLPDAARSLGKSMRIFKSELKEMQSDGSEQPAAQPGPRPITAERVENPAPAPAPAPAPQPAPDATDKHPA